MRRNVVVGVDPAREHDAALELAAAQAGRRGGLIHLVVVRHPGWTRPDQLTDVRLVGAELVHVDHELLLGCRRRIAEWGDDLEVSTEVMHGPVIPSLVAAARNADLLVLGHHRMSRAHPVPTLSVTHAVAARTTCPVYAVPDDWHELGDHPEPVVAAVEDDESGPAVAAAAFAEARRAGAPVRIVRAWCYPEIDTDEESLLHGTGGEVTAAIRRATAEALSDLMGRHDDVPCSIEVVHGQAVHTLVQASRRARLLVTGRHRPSHRWGPHLGPVTRSVLGHAHCPVVVVDTRTDPTSRTSRSAPGLHDVRRPVEIT